MSRHVLQLSPNGHPTTRCTRCSRKAHLADVMMGRFEMDNCQTTVGEDGRLRDPIGRLWGVRVTGVAAREYESMAAHMADLGDL